MKFDSIYITVIKNDRGADVVRATFFCGGRSLYCTDMSATNGEALALNAVGTISVSVESRSGGDCDSRRKAEMIKFYPV